MNQCPMPLGWYDSIVQAHGGGGKLMRNLIEGQIIPRLGNVSAHQIHDGACLQVGEGNIVFTTDSFVVRPLFFPGGNIGTLSVFGTCNDLAMCGAKPQFLSLGLILEEGLSIEVFQNVMDHIGKAAVEAGVQIVTGDTKVVEQGKGDGIYINTSGVGLAQSKGKIHPDQVEIGDVIIVNGDLGRHGVAVLSEREELFTEHPVRSDLANLWPLVNELINENISIHCLRDLTRGGLVAALNEVAQTGNKNVHLIEENIPIHPSVDGICELLGLDPLSVANEGRFVLFVPELEASRALDCLQNVPNGESSAIIGQITGKEDGLVTMTSLTGSRRVLDMPSGEQLPRIC